MKRFGIDVSKWQGDFDFNAAKKEGVSFAILKGGGGDDGLYKDGKFEQNYSAAKKLNIPVGAYWFSRALSVNDTIFEAEYFFNNILKGKQFELPIFIDIEHSDMLSLGKKTLTEIIKKWCSYLEEKKCFVGIYSTVYAFSAYMNDNELSDYTHWVAQWAEDCTYQNKKILGLWQFGGETNLIRKNTVAGIVCDQNYMYFDYPKLIKEKGFNGFDTQTINNIPVSAVKKTVSDLAKEVIAGKWGVGNERRERITNAGYSYDAVQSLVDAILTPSPSADLKTVRGGDLVKIASNATIYGTDKRFADFVYSSLLYVREIKKNRAVISTLPEGPVTGAVDVKYLTKHRT